MNQKKVKTRIEDCIYYSGGVPVFYRYEIHGGRPEALEEYMNRRLSRVHSKVTISCQTRDLILSATNGYEAMSENVDKGVILR